MELSLRLLALAVYLSLGILFTYRWVTHPPISLQRYPRWLRVATLFVISWLGIFTLAHFQNEISILYFDPDDFPEDRGLSATIAYDGSGNNVISFLFGWLAGPLFMIFARNDKV